MTCIIYENLSRLSYWIGKYCNYCRRFHISPLKYGMVLVTTFKVFIDKKNKIMYIKCQYLYLKHPASIIQLVAWTFSRLPFFLRKEIPRAFSNAISTILYSHFQHNIIFSYSVAILLSLRSVTYSLSRFFAPVLRNTF